MAPFRYDDYRNPYAGTIGDLILRQGEIAARQAEGVAAAQARAVETRGQAWAGAVQAITAIPERLQQQRDAAQVRDLRAQEITARKANLQAETEQRETAKQQRLVSVIGSIAKSAETPDEFASRVDDLVALGSLPRDVGDHIRTKALTGGADGWTATRTQYVNFAAQFVKPITVGEGAKVVNPVSGEVVADNPKPQRPISVAPGATLVNPTTQEPIFTADDPRATEVQRHNAAMEAIATQTGDRQDAARQETARHNREMERLRGQQLTAAQSDKTELTPEGLDAAALNYAKTGVLPPLGNGDKTTRKQIINRAAAMMPGLDVASAKADYDANKSTLTKLQQQRAAIGAFEQTAQRNIDVFLETAGKVVDTGSPLLNQPFRAISGKLLGSADQAAFDAARQVAINEIAKITSNPTLAGTLSDSARHEIEAFNPQSATLKQAVAVMRLLKRDMQNRTDALDEQIAGIQGRIKLGQGTAPPATAPPPRVQDTNAGSVPANVAAALKSVGPGRHTLSDGSVWIVNASGAITKVK